MTVRSDDGPFRAHVRAVGANQSAAIVASNNGIIADDDVTFALPDSNAILAKNYTVFRMIEIRISV